MSAGDGNQAANASDADAAAQNGADANPAHNAHPNAPQDDNAYAKRYTEALLDHRKLLIEAGQSRADLFDKSLIAIATGTMALSVTFMRFIAPDGVSTYLLFISWGAFTLSLLLTMLTLQFTQHGIEHELRALDRDLLGDDSPQKNPYKLTVWILSWVSFVVVVIGLWTFALFALENVGSNQHGREGTDTNKAATAKDQEKGSKEEGGEEKEKGDEEKKVTPKEDA